jgi:hypothetical protein
VLIPLESVAWLTLEQLEALLAHELAHILRHDYLVNMLQTVIEALLFFHPAVWWVSRRVRDEREKCCDDMAVALCRGDCLFVARALLAMEEQRTATVFGLAASGGTLPERIRRLGTASAETSGSAKAGWAGAGLIASLGLAAMIGAAVLPTLARDGTGGTGPVPVHGRVVDESGKPVSGTRVRLYRRIGQSERRHPMIEETTAGPNGSFQLRSPLVPVPEQVSRRSPTYVLLADHAGRAIGWRTIPREADTFEGDIVLTAPTERTITTIDTDGRPVAGAKVVAYGVGDASSASPLCRDYLGLRPDDGPLTATTDQNGRATIRQLPRTDASFVATKPGFGEGYAFREQHTIHLSPSAALSGRVTGPDGQPLAGVKVILFTDFMWDFESAETDSAGRYQFADLRARGWDMSAWGPSAKPGNGRYKVWIESDRFDVPTQIVSLEPRARETLDLKAERAGVIHVTVTQEGTGKAFAGVRVWGWDVTTGGSSSFNAYTDENGRATFYSTPGQISLSIVGPPDGYYIKGDQDHPGMFKQIDFAGGEIEVSLHLPPFGGPIITVPGVCTRPDGSGAAGAEVSPQAGRFQASNSSSFLRMRRADDAGRFDLEGVPAGRTLHLYAETADRRFAGTVTVQTPAQADPSFRLSIPMEPTVAVEITFHDDKGKPLPSKSFRISPIVEDEDFPFLRRDVESDAHGLVKIDGIVPGRSYRVEEVLPPSDGPVAVVGGKIPWFNEVVVLAPKDQK